MVRYYILTEREREIIRAYLDKGLKLEGFRVLSHLLGKMDLSQIEKDQELVRAFLDKEAHTDH
jgi:hypothetical protein